MTCKTFFFAATFVLGSAIAPSLATAATPADAMETNVALVNVADLNLASPEGQSTLNARIIGAVNRVCGAASGPISIEERRAISACRVKARSTALADARTRREVQVLAQR